MTITMDEPWLKAEPDPVLLERAERERRDFEGEQIRPFVVGLANRGRVTASEWAVPMNTYERELLFPHLDTEVFVQMAEHCLARCSRRERGSYEVVRLIREALGPREDRLPGSESFAEASIGDDDVTR